MTLHFFISFFIFLQTQHLCSRYTSSLYFCTLCLLGVFSHHLSVIITYKCMHTLSLYTIVKIYHASVSTVKCVLHQAAVQEENSRHHSLKLDWILLLITRTNPSRGKFCGQISIADPNRCKHHKVVKSRKSKYENVSSIALFPKKPPIKSPKWHKKGEI